MYCSKCGKEIEEHGNFCSFCGAPNQKSYEQLVSEYLQGKEEAFNNIYYKTYNLTWTIARSFFPSDEMECQDCVQDIYYNLYENITKFDSSKGEFLPWFKKTANNICITRFNKIKKKNKLFIEPKTISDDSEQEIELVEGYLEFNPEAYIEKKEVSRLISVIMNELPEIQQKCISLFYIHQLKQEEISEILGVPKGTVKSRIFNGKKILEKKILELEKQGIKLYSMSPIVFFVWLFKQEGKAKAAEVVASRVSAFNVCKNLESIKNTRALKDSSIKEISNNEGIKTEVLKKTAGSGAKTAATKAAASKAVATKIIAAIVGASVIGTGGYVGIKYLHNQNNQVVNSKENSKEKSKENNQSITNLQSIEQSMDMDLMTLTLSYCYKAAKPEIDGLELGFPDIMSALSTYKEYSIPDETGLLGKYEKYVSVDSSGKHKIDKELADPISMLVTGVGIDEQPDCDSFDVNEEGVIDEIGMGSRGYTSFGFIKDISTKIDEKNNQILVSYSEPYDYTNLENSELVHYRYFHRRCAIVVPYQNELGYTIESVEDGQFFDDEKLKEIANNLQVPDSLNVNYKQEAKANYWEEADKYLVKVEVLSDDQVVASALVDHQTGELCKNILNYKDPKEESIALNIYQPLIDAYRQYYFNGVETEGILTENIIFQEMYGVSNPYQWVAQFRFEAIQQPLYYGLIDLNNDGYEECIFTSNDLSDPEYVQVYDIWTRDDTSFYHLFSGGPHQHNAFCEDGTVMEYGDGGWDTGGYRWFAYDNHGNVTEIDRYYFDSENPLNENIVNEKKEQHKIVHKNINLIEIQK